MVGLNDRKVVSLVCLVLSMVIKATKLTLPDDFMRMKGGNITTFKKIFFLLLYSAAFHGFAQENRLKMSCQNNFNEDWEFMKLDSLGKNTQSQWRKLDLPHDWSIENLPNQIPNFTVGPFTSTAVGKSSTGFTVGGQGIYRKKLTLDKSFADKTIFLEFEGVYMLTEVWVNNRLVGKNQYGYTPFSFDIAPFLAFGRKSD